MCISSNSIPTNLFLGVSVCLCQAPGKGQLSFARGMDIPMDFLFVFVSSLNSDVLYGSYYLCYPRPGLICHHELVGVMADLVPFQLFGLEL